MFEAINHTFPSLVFDSACDTDHIIIRSVIATVAHSKTQWTPHTKQVLLFQSVQKYSIKTTSIEWKCRHPWINRQGILYTQWLADQNNNFLEPFQPQMKFDTCQHRFCCLHHLKQQHFQVSAMQTNSSVHSASKCVRYLAVILLQCRLFHSHGWFYSTKWRQHAFLHASVADPTTKFYKYLKLCNILDFINKILFINYFFKSVLGV